MSYQYATRKRAETAVPQTEKVAPAAPSMDALRAGAAAPTQQMLGHKVDLPNAIRQKMEDSFQADLSSVQLYESQAVADAGAKAMAQGNRIAFAPGQLDLTSSSGQALLGHELSHVVSQARGEVACQGFLQDSALEARADREGAMAAAGESIYSGVTPLSDVSCAPAAGPMQAKGKKKKPEISEPQEVRHVSRDEIANEIDMQAALRHMKDPSEKAQAAVAQRFEEKRSDLKSRLHAINKDETTQNRFGTLSPMLDFLEQNSDIALVQGWNAMGTVQSGKAQIALSLFNKSNTNGKLRAQMLHESTHLRNTVAGHNALTPSAEPFAFRNGAIMQGSNNNAAHTGLPTPGVTRANLDYGRAVNEPRDMAGQVFGSTIQKDVMGDADSFQKHLNKHMNTSDQQRSADVQKELMRIGVAITKSADDENLAEPSSYLNQMMYLMYENQDMFDSAFFDSNRFKALQHYTGILNDTTNYGKAENGGVGIRNLTSYGRAGKKRQKPTT